jgi:3-oxoadipate enol-lactonase
MPFAQVNDVKLHYEMEGSGPPLLMVAGTGLPGATWRTGPSAQYAAEGFTVITFDHRGTGGSDKPDVDYSTRMFAADAVGLLQALDIPQGHILGHSMGGRVVQWLALDHPERVGGWKPRGNRSPQPRHARGPAQRRGGVGGKRI